MRIPCPYCGDRDAQEVIGLMERVLKVVSDGKPARATATRDEVESYERKLRRNRLGVMALAATICLRGP